MLNQFRKLPLVSFISLVCLGTTSAHALDPIFPIQDSAVVFEVEKGEVIGEASIYEDYNAFGSSGVAYIYLPGAGFKLNHVPKSKYLTLRYASEFEGEISIYLNGEFSKVVPFVSTGAWVVNYEFATVKLDIEDNSTFEVRYTHGDTPLNIDQVIFSDTFIDLRNTVRSEMFLDNITNGVSSDPIGTKNNSGIYTDIEENNDDFSTEVLSWNVLNPQKLQSATIVDGELTLRPAPYNTWLHKMRGPQLHKVIQEDNFSVTAKLEITTLDGSDISTTIQPFMHSGLMVRKADKENTSNFYHGSIGVTDTPVLTAEYKNTQKNVSWWEFLEWDHSVSEIRICRFENEMSLYMRPVGGEWILMNETVREDLAGEVYVGPFSYSHNDTPDILARFDYVNFAGVANKSDCSN